MPAGQSGLWGITHHTSGGCRAKQYLLRRGSAGTPPTALNSICNRQQGARLTLLLRGDRKGEPGCMSALMAAVYAAHVVNISCTIVTAVGDAARMSAGAETMHRHVKEPHLLS